MTGESQFFCFRDGNLSEVTETGFCENNLAAADSWLVEDGRVRALSRSFFRFSIRSSRRFRAQVAGFLALNFTRMSKLNTTFT
jgi:hypothetical protein